MIVSLLHTSSLMAYGIVSGKHENDRAHIIAYISDVGWRLDPANTRSLDVTFI